MENQADGVIIMRFAFLILVVLCSAACSQQDERYDSSLIDDLSGVWVYPSEQVASTSIVVVEGHHWKEFDYQPGRIDTDPKSKGFDSGDVLGQEGVYYFTNPTTFYSPHFLVRTSNGNQFLILNHSSYDRYIKTGQIEVQILIRVASSFDPEKPPVRPSIATLGVPYFNIFAPKK